MYRLNFSIGNRFSKNRLSYRDCISIDAPSKVWFVTTTSTSHTTSSSSTSSTSSSTSSTSSSTSSTSSSTSTTLGIMWNNYWFVKASSTQSSNPGILSVAEKIR